MIICSDIFKIPLLKKTSPFFMANYLQLYTRGGGVKYIVSFTYSPIILSSPYKVLFYQIYHISLCAINKTSQLLLAPNCHHFECYENIPLFSEESFSKWSLLYFPCVNEFKKKKSNFSDTKSHNEAFNPIVGQNDYCW